MDEAANTLMTRLGFLLGEKVSEGSQGPQYRMDEPDDAQVGYSTSPPAINTHLPVIYKKLRNGETHLFHPTLLKNRSSLLALMIL